MLEFLQFYQTNVAPVVRFFPILALLILWFALVRAGFSPKARMTGVIVTGLLLVWWVASDQLGRSGLYTEHWGVMRPVCWMIAILWVIPVMRRQRSVPRSMPCRCDYSRFCRFIAPVAAWLGLG